MKQRKITAYIIIIAALILVVLAIRMAPSGSVDTPEVILPPEPTQSEDPADSGDKTDSAELRVTPDTVQAVVATLSRPDGYSRTLTVTRYWSGGKREETINVWVRGESTRISIGEEGEKNILLSGGEKWIWYSDASEVYKGTALEGEADEYQTIPTYETLLLLDKKSIGSAGYAELLGQECVFADTYAENGDTCRMWISVKTGLLVGCEIYSGEELVYEMKSTEPDISTPDESIFLPPES